MNSTPNHKPKITLSNLHDVVSAAPHLIGFNPTDSLVLLPLSGGGPVVRVDMPTSAPDVLDVLAAIVPVLQRHQVGDCILLAYSDREDYATAVLETIAAGLPNPAGVLAMLTVAGDDWTEIRTLQSGHVTQADRDRLAVQFVAQGRPAPANRREDLADRYAPTKTIDGGEVAAALVARDNDLADFTAAAVAAVDHAISENRTTRAMPTPGTAALILTGLDLGAVRDAALAAHRQAKYASVDVDLWAYLLRIAPTGYRDHPAALAALTAWLNGDGAGAWTALDLQTTPTTLGRLMAVTLSGGMHPHAWADLLASLETDQTDQASNQPGEPGDQAGEDPTT